MAETITVRVPDIGDFDAIEVIEVLVSAGDTVTQDQSLITLESDKASMEIPSTHDGVVTAVMVNVGDKLSKDSAIVILASGELSMIASSDDASVETDNSQSDAKDSSSKGSTDLGDVHDIVVPDVGDFDEVEVIEVLVRAGEAVDVDQSLITLESDKASMEIPSTNAGIVDSIMVAVGDKVSSGSVIGTIKGTIATYASASVTVDVKSETKETVKDSVHVQEPRPHKPQPAASPTQKIDDESYRRAHASPAVRKFGRELGVDLQLVEGSGRKNRILKEDVQQFVKSAMSASGSNYGGGGSAGAAIPAIPEVDFSKFGDVERVEMSRINVLTAENLHRAWLNLPMVTHHDEVDITELEAFRKSIKEEASEQNIRVTGLVFHIKALATTLKSFPRFNSSLSADGKSLYYKKYFNIGIAVDTPNGLVVPVLTDVNNKSIFQLSEEMTDLSTRAREKKLKPSEMQGASMTISSLGGIGGAGFTPIVNPPEVAILGITRAKMQPVWNGDAFIPRLMCPLDLTYDHRVIDGADGARFMSHYCRVVGDIRKMLLY